MSIGTASLKEMPTGVALLRDSTVRREDVLYLRTKELR